MSMAINDGGVQRTLSALTINDGGVQRNLAEYSVNDGGTIRTIFSSTSFPEQVYVTYNGATTPISPNSTGYFEFEVPSSTTVLGRMTVTEFRIGSGIQGSFQLVVTVNNGSATMSFTNVDTHESLVTLNASKSSSGNQSVDIPAGKYYIGASGGYGSQSGSGYGGYKIRFKFSKK